jgi:hypothetical protein
MGHLDDVKQTYFEHLNDTLNYSITSFYAGIIFALHGIFPDLFVFTGSFTIAKLNNILVEKKKKLNLL